MSVIRVKKTPKPDGKKDEAGSGEEENSCCGRCKLIVRSVDNGLECDGCGVWFHAGCEGVTQEKYKFLEKYKDTLWFCKKCHMKVVAKNAETQKLRDENHELRREVAELKALNENLISKFEELWKGKEEEIVEITTKKVLKVLSSKESEMTIAQHAVEKVLEVIEEREEKEKKKNNIVVFNLAESIKETVTERKEEDKIRLDTVIQGSLKIEDYEIEDIYRVGRPDQNKPRPTIVKLKEGRAKWEIIKNAQRLREDPNQDNRKVGIAPDMTRKEREENRKLREELQRKRDGGGRWIIKRGKIVNLDVQHY